MQTTKTLLQNLEPMIKNVGSWDNARISRAIAIIGYRNTTLEDIHTQDGCITKNVRDEIFDGLATAIRITANMQPLIELDIDDMEECMLNMPEDVNLWVAEYVRDMVLADAWASSWDAPSEVSREIFDILDDELCEMDNDDWPEAIASFVLAGKFDENYDNKVVLTDDVVVEMNRDVHNRMFTVLEHFDDCLYGYFG